MKALLALLRVLRRGEQVADPALWKTRQITANALAGFFVAVGALSGALGLPLEINDADALSIAVGVLALWNVVLTAATTRKIGLPAPPAVAPEPGGPTDAGA